jgi:hypothetical protein
MLRFEARGLRVNFTLPSSLLLLLFFLPFTWGRHRRACATTALPVALILFGVVVACRLWARVTRVQFSAEARCFFWSEYAVGARGSMVFLLVHSAMCNKVLM